VRRPLRATVVAPILAGVLAVSAIAVAGSWSTRDADAPREASRHLHLRSSVAKMYPGRVTTYRVRIRNPLSVRVGVYRIRAHVRRGHGPLGRCPARWLRISPWKGMRRIPAGSVRRVRLEVRMRKRAPDRCQGTRWRIEYEAKSVRI